MSDLYTEVIVKRKKTVKDTLCKAGLVVLTVLAVFSLLLGILGLISIVVMLAVAALDYFIWPTLDVEYEYLYVNGEIDIDKIMSRQKRKRVYSCDLKKLELMAPSSSHELDYQKNNKNITRHDFSSMEENAKTYTAIIPGDKGTEMLIFEPNQTIVDDLKRLKPREVKLY